MYLLIKPFWGLCRGARFSILKFRIPNHVLIPDKQGILFMQYLGHKYMLLFSEIQTQLISYIIFIVTIFWSVSGLIKSHYAFCL